MSILCKLPTPSSAFPDKQPRPFSVPDTISSPHRNKQGCKFGGETISGFRLPSRCHLIVCSPKSRLFFPHDWHARREFSSMFLGAALSSPRQNVFKTAFVAEPGRGDGSNFVDSCGDRVEHALFHIFVYDVSFRVQQSEGENCGELWHRSKMNVGSRAQCHRPAIFRHQRAKKQAQDIADATDEFQVVPVGIGRQMLKFEVGCSMGLWLRECH